MPEEEHSNRKLYWINYTANFINKHGLAFLTGLITVFVVIIFHDFIFFHKLYLFKGLASDSLNDTYPNYILVSDYLRQDGMPKWSFRQGMGQNIFPFSFPDPFVSILYLLERTQLALGIAYMEIVKIYLAGILFYLFLRKRSLSVFTCITGGLLYSFSSFMIIGSCWNLFSTEVVYLAFLLLSFEHLYQNNNFILFPVSAALISVLQPFDLWLFGLFLLIYVIVRYQEDAATINKKFYDLLIKTALLGILGVGIGSFFFLSEIRMMLLSPRVGGAAGLFHDLYSKSVFGFESGKHYVTAIMRLFSSELLGPSNSFEGWKNFMEAPLFYCGLINLLLLPQLFQFLNTREKKLYGLWMIIIILPVIVPFLRYALWLFTGDYYRLYGFFVAFILMFFSLKALHYMLSQAKVNLILLLATLGVLFILLYYPYDYLNQADIFHRNILNTHLRNLVSCFLISYVILLSFLKNKLPGNAAWFLMIILISAEVITFTKLNVDERRAVTHGEYNQKKGYWDNTNDAISYLNNTDKGFFRIAKAYHSAPTLYHPSLNDSKIQKFRGTKSYHSFNHLHYIRFLSGMDLIDENKEAESRWVTGLSDKPSLHSFASVKYFFTKNQKPFYHPNYTYLRTIGDVRIYRNDLVLPLGFTYSGYITRRDFNKISPNNKRSVLYKAFILNDSIYKDYVRELPVADISSDYSSLDKYRENIRKLKEDTLRIDNFRSYHIKGSINLKEKKMLFLSIPYSPGWTAKVNGEKKPILRINIGFTGILLDKGNHQIELSFKPPLFNTGAIVSVISLIIYFGMIVVNRKRRKTVGYRL